MSDIPLQLTGIRNRIGTACLNAERIPDEVTLVAVSKTFPAECIREAYDAGQRVFGESRLQEALPKMDLLPSDIHWHFIGRVQRNKLRKILAAFEVIHGIDSPALASAANEVAAGLDMFPKIYLQVNLAGEESKGGFSPDQLEASISDLLKLPRLKIQGLMAIPPIAESADDARRWFQALRELRDRIEHAHDVRLPSLSMGMSDDFEAAIAEGATLVRVGSAIFGKR